MGKITVFNHLSVDGFFAGPKGEIEWFKVIERDPEYDKFTHGASGATNTLVFGHKTYDMMKSYWPTPEALKSDPDMAKTVDHSPKLVFSKSLSKVEEGPNWKNVELVHAIKRDEISKRKQQGDMTILGSGSIVQQIANMGLIDEYCLIQVPIVLGEGKPLFEDVKEMNLELLESRAFKNGLVVHRYVPAKS